MKLIQLFRDNKEILGTDGVMYVDGRFGQYRTVCEVENRNKRMVNFPHKIADSFATYTGHMRSNDLGKMTML